MLTLELYAILNKTKKRACRKYTPQADIQVSKNINETKNQSDNAVKTINNSKHMILFERHNMLHVVECQQNIVRLIRAWSATRTNSDRWPINSFQ